MYADLEIIKFNGRTPGGTQIEEKSGKLKHTTVEWDSRLGWNGKFLLLRVHIGVHINQPLAQN